MLSCVEPSRSVVNNNKCVPRRVCGHSLKPCRHKHAVCSGYIFVMHYTRQQLRVPSGWSRFPDRAHENRPRKTILFIVERSAETLQQSVRWSSLRLVRCVELPSEVFQHEWAVIFIPIPLPEQVIQTFSCTIPLYNCATQTVLGMGMGMNVTAQWTHGQKYVEHLRVEFLNSPDRSCRDFRSNPGLRCAGSRICQTRDARFLNLDTQQSIISNRYVQGTHWLRVRWLRVQAYSFT